MHGDKRDLHAGADAEGMVKPFSSCGADRLFIESRAAVSGNLDPGGVPSLLERKDSWVLSEGRLSGCDGREEEMGVVQMPGGYKITADCEWSCYVDRRMSLPAQV